MEWPDERVLQLINELKAFPVLYDVKRPEYRNKILWKKALDFLEGKFGIPGVCMTFYCHSRVGTTMAIVGWC